MWGEGGESSGYGGLEADRSLFRPDVDSPLEQSLLVGTRGRHGLTMDNYTNSELANSGDTGPLL